MSRRLLSDGRVLVVAALAAYFLTLLVWGERAWRWFGVGAAPIRFADLHAITAAWECSLQKGVDVLSSRPCPCFCPLNYPRIWLLPRALGRGPWDTYRLGVLVLCAFFAAALVLMGRQSWKGGLVWALVLVSPPVMLGVNRGNIELVVFAVLVVAILLFRARRAAGRVGAHACLLLAAVLKLYPVFAFVLVLRQSPRWRLVGGGALLLVFGAYALATRHDIQEISAGVPRPDDYSYGAAVLRDWVRRALAPYPVVGLVREPGLAALLFGLLLVGAVALGAALSWRLGIVPQHDEGAARAVDAFWVGAALYLGSFAIYWNYDYRLICSLFVLPLLLRSAGEPQPLVALPRLGIGLLLATLWFSAVAPLSAVGSFQPFDWLLKTWFDAVGVPLGVILSWFLAAYLCAGVFTLLHWRPARESLVPAWRSS